MMNKQSKPSQRATAPDRAPGKKSNGYSRKSNASSREIIGLARELRSHQNRIEMQNKELRRAMAGLVSQNHAEESLQKSLDALERTIEERSFELRHAYELLKSIFASIDVHIAYLDTDFNFITVNHVYAAADKRRPDFYFGKNYFELYPEKETEGIFRDVIETGEPYYEYQKAILSVEHPEQGVTYWDWSVQPVKGSGNTVTGLVLSMINVTDRKRAEENTIRLATAIESTGDSVIITDVRGMIKYVNPAFEKITGYSKKEAIGRDKEILESGQQDETFYHNVREAIRRHGSWTGQVVSRKKNGRLFAEECTWSLIRNESGEIINYVSIGRDITEKLRLDTAAQAINSGSLTGGERYEFRDGIDAIIMTLNQLKTRREQMDTSALDGQIDELLNRALKIDRMLKK